MRFNVESWSPEFGSPVEALALEDAPGATVNVDVELPAAQWAPLESRPDTSAASVLFVDGVRRIDARVWITDEAGTVRLGICASYAAGIVRCDGRATVEGVEAERGLFTSGVAERIVTAYGVYSPRLVANADIEHLINGLQQQLGALEIRTATAARPADLVVVDGPLSGRENVPGAIGYIKSHRVEYLPPAVAGVVAQLRPGQRSPLFLTETTWSRFSWYLRLPGGSGHPWAGIVRCEASAGLSVEEARYVADRSVATLPRFASAPHKDTRAPQNLYPIGGLERELRRRLGDGQLLYRSLCLASRQPASGAPAAGHGSS